MKSDIIAERIFYLDGNPDEPVIRLQITRPEKPADDYPSCWYLLTIEGKMKETRISNVDTVHCLSVALLVAGTEIAALNDTVYNRKLRWDGWSGGADIGLPLIDTNSEPETLRWAGKKAFTE